MGLRFWRRVRVLPGVTLNVTRNGPTSVSLGTRGAHWTVSRIGPPRATVGLPGTGLFYTTTFRRKPGPTAPPRPRLGLVRGFVWFVLCIMAGRYLGAWFYSLGLH